MDTHEKLIDEGLITMAQAAKLLPGRAPGKKVSVSSVLRYATHGWGKGGVIRLEAVRTPGRWYTSKPAVARFLAAVRDYGDNLGRPPAAPEPDPAQSAGHRAAVEFLRANGVKVGDVA